VVLVDGPAEDRAAPDLVDRDRFSYLEVGAVRRSLVQTSVGSVAVVVLEVVGAGNAIGGSCGREVVVAVGVSCAVGQAAGWYSLMSPPTTGRRRIRWMGMDSAGS
jgi:hypothetical protein